MIILATISIALIAILIILIVNAINKKKLSIMFSEGNVIVFGKKRKGKDLIFNAVINSRKKKCFSNIQFNEKYDRVKEFKDYDIKFDYKDFINGKVEPMKRKNYNFEDNSDYYFSDGGIYLPCQYNNELDKQYKSLPILYALSSQAFGFNIHINTQALNRPWDKIREQADYYIKALKTTKIFGFLITRYRVYDKYSSALQDLRPFKTSGGLLTKSKESKSQRDMFNAMNGEIKEHFIVQRCKAIKYDTRAFRKKLVIEESEEKK